MSPSLALTFFAVQHRILQGAGSPRLPLHGALRRADAASPVRLVFAPHFFLPKRGLGGRDLLRAGDAAAGHGHLSRTGLLKKKRGHSGVRGLHPSSTPVALPTTHDVTQRRGRDGAAQPPATTTLPRGKPSPTGDRPGLPLPKQQTRISQRERKRPSPSLPGEGSRKRPHLPTCAAGKGSKAQASRQVKETFGCVLEQPRGSLALFSDRNWIGTAPIQAASGMLQPPTRSSWEKSSHYRLGTL